MALPFKLLSHWEVILLIKMIKKYGDTVPAVFLIILSVIYLIMSFKIDVQDKYGGSALIPQICAGIVILCSLVLIYREIFKKDANIIKDSPQPEDAGGEKAGEKIVESPPNYKLVVLTLVSITCYAVLFNVLGFIASTILYLVVQILLLTPKLSLKAIVIAAVTAVIVAVLIYLLFYNVFYVMLPRGSLWYNIF